MALTNLFSIFSAQFLNFLFSAGLAVLNFFLQTVLAGFLTQTP
jgi:hypothetical protein